MLDLANRNGKTPAANSVSLAEVGGGYPPYLMWQVDSSGDICMAKGDSVMELDCETVSQFQALPTPGVGRGMHSMLLESSGPQRWVSVLIASGETVEKLSCQGQDYPVHKGLTATVGGVVRTLYTVLVPGKAPGKYRVHAQRDGVATEDWVPINLESGDPVQC